MVLLHLRLFPLYPPDLLVYMNYTSPGKSLDSANNLVPTLVYFYIPVLNQKTKQ